jgi:hypothetical protein
MTAAPDTLAGTLALQPGRQPPNIRSTRPLLAPRLARGVAADELPDRLARVYALCGGAHRVAARLALAAAAGRALPDAPATAHALRADTLREHLRRIVLDWPAPLAGEAPSPAELQALRACPAGAAQGPVSAGAGPALGDWIERELLGEDAAGWLAAWDRDPDAALSDWAARAPTPTARRLRACRDAARAIVQPVRRLMLAGNADALAAIAAALRADARFALAPQFPCTPAAPVPPVPQGAGHRAPPAAFETGCWARAADPAPERHADAWLRLGARLAEAVRLALPPVEDSASRALHFGALALAADGRPAAPGVASGEGIGWCEMARGLLLHRVRLGADGDVDRVAECDVLAPTEWHFHPRGPVAEALARLPRRHGEAAARLLAAAFDPCVAVRVEAGDA